uniref:Uncharacterized protein n=1 Tax=Triticum urartu TaxID=4572 RepID=A0A8R7NZ86_TRIUA
ALCRPTPAALDHPSHQPSSRSTAAAEQPPLPLSSTIVRRSDSPSAASLAPPKCRRSLHAFSLGCSVSLHLYRTAEMGVQRDRFGAAGPSWSSSSCACSSAPGHIMLSSPSSFICTTPVRAPPSSPSCTSSP